MVADVPLGSGDTIYVRIGDVFAGFSIASTCLLCGYIGMLSFRNARGDDA